VRDLAHIVIFVVLFSGGVINSKAPDFQPESVHSNLAGLPTFGCDRRTPTFQTASSQ
jgi:hypothetical protein